MSLEVIWISKLLTTITLWPFSQYFLQHPFTIYFTFFLERNSPKKNTHKAFRVKLLLWLVFASLFFFVCYYFNFLTPMFVVPSLGIPSALVPPAGSRSTGSAHVPKAVIISLISELSKCLNVLWQEITCSAFYCNFCFLWDVFDSISICCCVNE